MKYSFGIAAMVAIACVSPSASHAQQTSTITPATASPTMSARNLLNQFRSVSGSTVDVAAGVDLDRPVPVPAGLFGSRSRLMENIAGATNSQWHKTWVVSAASSVKPLANASYLRGIVNPNGTVSFDATGLPAADAIRTVAQADGAQVQILGVLPVSTVNLSSDDIDIASAIAMVSRATNTSWSLTYTLTPGLSDSSTAAQSDIPRRFHVRPADKMQQLIANQEAPLTIHFKYPSTGPDPRVMDAGNGNWLLPNPLGPTITTPGQSLGYIGGYGSPLSGNYAYVNGYNYSNALGAATIGTGPIVTSSPTIGTTIAPTVTPMAVQPSNSAVISNQQPTATVLGP